MGRDSIGQLNLITGGLLSYVALLKEVDCYRLNHNDYDTSTSSLIAGMRTDSNWLMYDVNDLAPKKVNGTLYLDTCMSGRVDYTSTQYDDYSFDQPRLVNNS